MNENIIPTAIDLICVIIILAKAIIRTECVYTYHPLDRYPRHSHYFAHKRVQWSWNIQYQYEERREDIKITN